MSRTKGRRLPPPSLRTRVVGVVAALAALGLLGSGSAALVVEERRIEQRVDASLAQEIAEFSELSQGDDPETGEPFATSERLLALAMARNVPDRNETQVGFLPGATLVPADRIAAIHDDAGFRAAARAHADPAYGTWRSAQLGPIRYAVMPVVDEAGRSHYAAAYVMDQERAELRETIGVYGVAGVISWLALVMAAWLLAGRILRPINAVQRTAAQITETDASRRIAVEGGDEVAALGHTFNAMLDRLEEALDGQRRMLDDAGHELRTPITVIRGHLELMDPHDPADVIETRALATDELDRMSGLVGDLILLAKARRPDFLHLETVDTADLVARTLAKAAGLAPRRWVLDECAPLDATLDPNRIAQALLQFAANAVAVTGPEDEIAMGCRATRRGVRLWVRDTGPGIPADLRDSIFERWHSGHRPEPGGGAHGGSGTGLGLAIVAAIAQAHHGTALVVDEAARPAGGPPTPHDGVRDAPTDAPGPGAAPARVGGPGAILALDLPLTQPGHPAPPSTPADGPATQPGAEPTIPIPTGRAE